MSTLGGLRLCSQTVGNLSLPLAPTRIYLTEILPQWAISRVSAPTAGRLGTAPLGPACGPRLPSGCGLCPIRGIQASSWSESRLFGHQSAHRRSHPSRMAPKRRLEELSSPTPASGTPSWEPLGGDQARSTGRHIVRVTAVGRRDRDKPGERGPQKKHLSGGSGLVKDSEGRERVGSWLDDGDNAWLFGAHEHDEDGTPDAPFMDAVVKVYCTHTEPNFSLPWQKRRQYSSTGSGFMISGRRLLTNAHCVEHHTQVKVKRRGDDTKFVATVLAIGTECDIALLAVEDDAFWEGPEPLMFGGLPRLQDAVTVVGYPIGGDTISVTSGVVSRIEVTSYVHGSTELLGVQIDAAINAGNSGGPAFSDDGKCVGIAFQSLKSPDAENIGYVIPAPVIFHFLTDYERNGRYTGFPMLGINWQRMESPALRACMGLKPHQKGVLIRRVEPTSKAYGLLKEEDVLMKFDGVPVANDGTVPFRAGERISFGFLVSQKFAGETAALEVLRAGQEMVVEVPLKALKRLIPMHIEGRLPSYFIMAGLVFTPVVQPFLQSEYGSDYEYETPVKILDKLLHGQAEYDDQQVVVLAQVLANDVNIGYEETSNTQVLRFNGTPIRNLRHLVHLIDGCSDQYTRLDLEHSEIIILDTKAARAATQEILADHSIPSDRSVDMRAPFGEVEDAQNGATCSERSPVPTSESKPTPHRSSEDVRSQSA